MVLWDELVASLRKILGSFTSGRLALGDVERAQPLSPRSGFCGGIPGMVSVTERYITPCVHDAYLRLWWLLNFLDDGRHTVLLKRACKASI